MESQPRRSIPEPAFAAGRSRHVGISILLGLPLAVLALAGCQGSGLGKESTAANPATAQPRGAALGHADAPIATPRVEVSFSHPENFLDVRDSNYPTAQGQAEILATFRDYIAGRATVYLPEAESFRINFSNIKLAGVFLGIGKRRITSPGTPPLFAFDWAVTDREGKTVRSGSTTLEERNFMELYSNNGLDHEPFHYDEAILDDWLHNHLQN